MVNEWTFFTARVPFGVAIRRLPLAQRQEPLSYKLSGRQHPVEAMVRREKERERERERERDLPLRSRSCTARFRAKTSRGISSWR